MENRNKKGENVKPEIIDGYNKFMRGMNRSYQNTALLSMEQTVHEMD